ncbi:hypothetical protein G6F66_014753 [Rhizopus arrhizus]|nr:hypothetical protein G6F66_014753 [Rhizopus arrhizus]
MAGAAIEGGEIIGAAGCGGCCGVRCIAINGRCRSGRRWGRGNRRLRRQSGHGRVDRSAIGNCRGGFGSGIGRNHGAGHRCIAAGGLAGAGGQGGGQDDQGESAYDVHVSSQQK